MVNFYVICTLSQYKYFKVHSSPGVPLPDVASAMLVLSGREREGDSSVCTEAEVGLGLFYSGPTSMRNQRPREG